ncbi:MAG: metal-dependent transcriptional regulator [Magnetococcales bacterium]|nr:metal-dependent transcriptional regulator [Magnetococcales bacterium]NGZ28476.1 metal-dependent transcriptional regulator [Magnetococcales bacterium]
METERRRDELLEMLWRLTERHEPTLGFLRQHDTEQRYEGYLKEFSSNGMIRMEEGRILLTSKGQKKARDIVRRHRLAERLLVDVMGKLASETEEEACEFEHVLAPELVDAICTLLGHPTTCPHGQPIPDGACCAKKKQVVEMSVVSLTQVEAGQQIRIASIDTQDPQRLSRLLALGFMPGSNITLLQRYPTLVVQLEGRQIAFEESIGNDLRVWQKQGSN